jgi:hypothetical protein
MPLARKAAPGWFLAQGLTTFNGGRREYDNCSTAAIPQEPVTTAGRSSGLRRMYVVFPTEYLPGDSPGLHREVVPGADCRAGLNWEEVLPSRLILDR